MSDSNKWVIFDFDGTLADTVQAWVDTSNYLADIYNYKKITPEDYSRLKSKSSLEILRYLGGPLWKTVWKLPLVERAGRKKFAEFVAQQKFCPGIPDVLAELKRRGFRLALLTSNAAASIKAFFVHNNFADPFEFIYGGSALFKKGSKLKRLLRQYGISPAAALYVGDETRDIDAARQAGVKIASVTWGINDERVLSACRPDFLVKRPEELLSIIK